MIIKITKGENVYKIMLILFPKYFELLMHYIFNGNVKIIIFASDLEG
jgi:hypothetical protein